MYFMGEIAEFNRRVKGTKLKLLKSTVEESNNGKPTLYYNWRTPNTNWYENVSKSISLTNPKAIKSDMFYRYSRKPFEGLDYVFDEYRDRSLLNPTKYTKREQVLQKKPAYKSLIVKTVKINDPTKNKFETTITNSKTGKVRTHKVRIKPVEKNTTDLPNSNPKTTTTQNIKPKPKSKILTGKNLAIGAGVLGVGGVGYAGYRYLKNRNKKRK